VMSFRELEVSPNLLGIANGLSVLYVLPVVKSLSSKCGEHITEYLDGIHVGPFLMDTAFIHSFRRSSFTGNLRV